MFVKWSLAPMLMALWCGTASAQDISQCPDNFVAFSGTTEPLSCSCDEAATRRGSVWGMDVYTSDSAICVAAVHAGAISRRGGQVTLVPQAGKSAYPGVTRNGVASNNFGAYESSYRFERPATSTSGTAVAPAQTAQATVSVCPDNFTAYADTNEPVICSCDANSVARGSVWGMDVYTGDSAICRAATHAGVISRQGGTVSVIPEPGRRAYPGVRRNGVQSINFGAYASSFRFAGPRAASILADAAAGVTDCPDNMAAFAGSSESLTCSCDASAAQRGSVWGMDVYTGDSATCRAALHAGVIQRQGGQVTAIPEAGRSAYPGVTRNGVQSQNFGRYDSSYRFAPGTRTAAAASSSPAVATSAPVQQNIQSSLRERGQVDLYIRFKFNSADLEISAADTMRTLQSVLTEDPSLRLRLIGHTDSVGTPQYNRTLSYRRAEAVKAWLVEQGIAANRLSVDGLGQTQPLADNASEFGRATNRRVQGIRM